MTKMRTPRHRAIAFLALAILRARKGQFNAKTRSATMATLSQCVKASAIMKQSTMNCLQIIFKI